MLSDVIIDSNEYLRASTELYSSLTMTKSSNTHQISLARIFGSVLIYRLLLNDTIQHEREIEVFLSKTIEVVSTTKNEQLLSLLRKCRTNMSCRQNLKQDIKLTESVSKDIIWVIKYALRDIEYEDFSWMFGLVSGLMILKGNKYGKS